MGLGPPCKTTRRVAAANARETQPRRTGLGRAFLGPSGQNRRKLAGCALFLVNAFLNHAAERTTERVIEDGVLFLRARTALQAGTELTTSYFTGAAPAKWDF